MQWHKSILMHACYICLDLRMFLQICRDSWNCQQTGFLNCSLALIRQTSMCHTQFMLWLPVVCDSSALMQFCEMHSPGGTCSGALAHECVHATATFITILHTGNASWLFCIHMSLCLQCTPQQCPSCSNASCRNAHYTVNIP